MQASQPGAAGLVDDRQLACGGLGPLRLVDLDLLPVRQGLGHRECAYSNTPRARVPESAPCSVDRVARFLRSPRATRSSDLALAAFAWQFERVEPYRRMCERRGATPESRGGLARRCRRCRPRPSSPWRSTPRRRSRPSARAARLASGALDASPSLPGSLPARDRRLVPATSASPAPAPLPMLSLVPAASRSSRIRACRFMIDHVLGRWGAPDSVPRPSRRAASRWRKRAPGWERSSAPIARCWCSPPPSRWPSCSKRWRGRTCASACLPAPPSSRPAASRDARASSRAAQLTARVEERLGVPASRVVREYGMTELTSQCYTRRPAGRRPRALCGAATGCGSRLLDPDDARGGRRRRPPA